MGSSSQAKAQVTEYDRSIGRPANPAEGEPGAPDACCYARHSGTAEPENVYIANGRYIDRIDVFDGR